MKRTLTLASRALALAMIVAPATVTAQHAAQPNLGTRGVPLLTRDGLRFKDLNRSGAVEPYEDWRLTPEQRARDLVARMTLEEKAGAMMHGTARSTGARGGVGMGARYDTSANRELIDRARVNSMITRRSGDPSLLAAEHNALQAIAEATRLGIPLTISTDPRNHFQYVAGATVAPGQFSQWPEALGLAALGDTGLVRRFGDIARQEYRAVGIHMALSPQADLATEPRWGRIAGTFGEDAGLAGRLVRAYVQGFQHGPRGIDTAGVATVVKHWVGYGAAKDGWDSHSYYGRFASIDAAGLEYHARPFEGAFAANVAGVMPTYSILQGASWRGRPVEQVGAAFSRLLLTEMLRGQYGFRGMVLTDWAITNDCGPRCRDGAPPGERPSFADLGMPWGLEDVPMRDRFVRAVQAGVDQFGGTEQAAMLVDAVRAGQLTEARLDTSVARVMALKIALGLFENPYVDVDSAAHIVGRASFRAAALEAQRRALVLLENRNGMLPLPAKARRVYLHGIPAQAVAAEGWTVVENPADADLAIVRLGAPHEMLHPGYIFGTLIHEGTLEFREGTPDYDAFVRASAAAPTIVTVYLDRPAILTPLKEKAAAIIANFGVSDAALLDVITGRAKPEGTLPFELPSSMSAVAGQLSHRPYDSARPLYRFGYGLRY